MENFWLQPRSIVAYAVSLLALAEIIDLTIVAVAIPQMMGSLGANIESIAMVTTSYIVAAAVFIMLSGIVVRKYGMKRIILFSGTVFCIASILCGQATSVPEMVVFRLIQGIGGAFLPSVAQSYIARRFEGEQRSKMMVIFSLVVVMGPIIGPVLGGVLIAHLSWRWIFYVNVPICIIAVTLISIYMQNEPMKKIKIDYISFAFMAIGIGLLEYFIDQGNSHNWFDSLEMIIILTASVILIGFFIWRGLLGSTVVTFSIFKNYNFVLSCLSMFIFMLFVTATLAYFPTMMQNIYNYPVEDAGFITVPRGLTAMLTAVFIPKLSKLFGERVVMAAGIGCFAFGSYMLSTYGSSVSLSYVVTSMVFQGFGMMAFFIPVMQICFIGIADSDNSDASGVFNFSRNFAASVGTSISATIISQQMQVNYNDLGANISPYHIGYQLWSQNLPGASETMKATIANTQVLQQSNYISYLDSFYLFTFGLLAILWMPFILKKRSSQQQSTEANKGSND